MAVAAPSLRSLRLLLIEDCDQDATLLLAELAHSGYDVIARRVQTAEEMRAALRDFPIDVVVSDYSLPRFSAPEALAIAQESHSHIPFIIVSGTIGEETAVSALKAGAADFLVKGKLARLVPALERELREAELKQTRAREREELEAQLRQSQKLEGIGRLAGGIAHDFNNLLTAILGYTEMILDQIGADKPISRDLEEIRKASDRAAVLTRQLLAFSRKQTLRVAAVDANEVVTGMLDMLRRLIGEDIDLQLNVAPTMAAMRADRGQVEQVLLNLVINARDAMPKGGRITIDVGTASANESITPARRAASSMRYVRVGVTDTGIGMDEATKARIFEPFFTTKPIGQGTGLGLSMVYGVVKQLGGQIDVRTAPGEGTTFALYFPSARDVDVVIGQSAPKVGTPLAEGREVVLVVEDQPAVLTLVSRVLSRHGYMVLEAADAEAGLALASSATKRIDLVLVDMVMPGMDGPEMVERIREKRPGLKVLFMSGYSADTIARRGGLSADATVLEKPFKPNVLLQAVRSALEASE